MKDILINPEEITELPQENLTIIDFGNADRYKLVHLPKAINVPKEFLMGAEEPSIGRLPSKAYLDNFFASIGYTTDTTYVVYDDDLGTYSGRFIWLLDSIGHTKYHYLNGGIKAYLKAQLPLSKTENVKTKTEVDLQVNENYTISKAELLEKLNSPDISIWDNRSEDEYLGKKQNALFAGHIPNAKNLEYLKLIDEKTLKIKENAKELIENAGIDLSKEIIVYCQTHRRSSLAYLTLKSLNIPKVRAFAGSWSDWGNDASTPKINPTELLH